LQQSNSDYEDRYREEAEFFDREASEFASGRTSLKFSNELNYEQYFEHYHTYREIREFIGSLKGKRILDFACGSGYMSIYFARSGAEAYGFDISPKSIEVAVKMAADNALSDRCKFKVTSAESMDYADNFFDVVFGNAALHHTDLDKSPAEIARVLKPGGKAAFIDDLRYHPVMWLYRKFTSDKHTRHETPMLRSDIEKFRPYFSQVQFDCHNFFNLYEKSRGLANLTQIMDRTLMTLLPFTKSVCRNLIIKATK